ncbi:MAG: hypothetical protein FJZ01_28370, partial [Candidatus Sericytochromatia bacterium]|nr:hypothetical protein [Candidatus Tanganyikabacteria bacterium]
MKPSPLISGLLFALFPCATIPDAPAVAAPAAALAVAAAADDAPAA